MPKVWADLCEVSNVVALSAQLVKGLALLMTVTLPGAPRAGVLCRVGNQVRRRHRSRSRSNCSCTRNTSAHHWSCSSTSLSPIAHSCCLWKQGCK